MKKTISCIFLISCTSIGAGILALPCITIYNGAIYSNIIFFICYIFMTLSSFLILESTIWFKKSTNIISITNQILGYKWKIIISTIYILLLYSLISAYILAYTKWITYDKIYLSNNFISISIYIILISIIILNRNNTINKANNVFSIFLFITYGIIIAMCFMYIKHENFAKNNIQNINNLLTIAITSFGFGIIIPSLSDFLKKDRKKLFFSLLIGSIIPLVAYIIWITVMLGIFPTENEFSLENLTKNKIDIDIIFTNFIKNIINQENISVLIKYFAILAILTSLIGVSTSLKDFLSDERIFKKNKFLILIAIIIPPIIVIIYSKLCFISVLKISGILVSILLGILPTIIVWHGRYNLKIKSSIIIPGGKITLILNIIFFIFVIINDLIQFI